MDALTRHARRLTALWALGTVVATGASLTLPGPVLGPGWALVLVTGGFVAAEFTTLRIRRGATAEGFTVSEVPLVAGLLFLGPVGLVGARLIGAGVGLYLDRRQERLKLFFNLTMWSWQAATAMVLLLLVAGDDRISPAGVYTVLGAIAFTDMISAIALNSIIARVRDEPMSWTRILATLRAGLPPALSSAAFTFVFVHTAGDEWVLVGPLLFIALSIWLAFRAETDLLAEREGLQRVAELGAVVIDPSLDEEGAVRALLREVGTLLEAEVVGLRLTEPGGEVVVFATDGRAEALFADMAPVSEPRVLSAEDCGGVVRDGLVVPLPPDAPVTGSLLVAEGEGEAASLGLPELRVAATLAGQLATMVHNARLTGVVRAQARQAGWEARHDPLTQLPNRLWLDEHLATVTADEHYSLLLLDLDGFKTVNDALGHSSGDELLVDFATRLVATMPADAMITRFAGDEFVCLLPGPIERGLEVATATRAHFQSPSNIRGMHLSVLPSIGLSHHPTDGTDTEELIRAADVAMFRGKRDQSGVARFAVEDAEHAARQFRLAGDLREAIRGEHLTCVYQPIVDTATGAVHHLEALARWHHPVLGPVSPDEFIVLAEQGGLIRELTMHVARQAARACRRWLADGLAAGVAVNLSPQSLSDASIPYAVKAILAEEGLPAEHFAVEITETTLLTDAGRALPLLAEFEAAGISVAIDDFGTGYSSLAHLGRIPVDVLKVDRSLVQNRRGRRGGTILRAVIDLAAALGLTVVAEGIEDREDYLWLRDAGCALGQGYFMGRPMVEEDLRGWRESWSGVAAELRDVRPRHLAVAAVSERTASVS
ncbi:EAL domain-containing protein [Euzebya sp.]|uniref:EAL domain-containing protein n=1 Tax=Euzebya sp. TaxID=1971409 RepID=UPI003515FE20